MTPISYDFELDYSHSAEGKLCPLLRLVASIAGDPAAAVELEAVLDSGAERSLFNGKIGLALGLDVLRGPEISFSSVAGSLLSANLHSVRLSHADLGTFELEVAFSTGEIRRNILGRDFFDLVQVGFREHQLKLFVTPTP